MSSVWIVSETTPSELDGGGLLFQNWDLAARTDRGPGGLRGHISVIKRVTSTRLDMDFPSFRHPQVAS